jgi:hypothetical protein
MMSFINPDHIKSENRLHVVTMTIEIASRNDTSRNQTWEKYVVCVEDWLYIHLQNVTPDYLA